MAAIRGRNRHEMGGFLSVYNVGGFQPVPGQPVMIRMQGVPTMPGYRDRVPKWNVLMPPLLMAVELVRRAIERIG